MRVTDLVPFYMSPEDMSTPMLAVEVETVCKAIKRYETRFIDPSKRERYEALYPWRDALNDELHKREKGDA